MPPNRFESEVESFLEGSHGDRTHIKRADHHTVTPLCGTLLGGDARTTHQDSDRFRQIADPFSKTSRFWSLFTQWVCSLATTPPQTANSPPPNGGNCIIRAATRRRYPASQLLMLQNPHRFPCGEQRRGRMARLRCPWAPEGPEGTGELQNAGPGRGAGGRWQGQGGPRDRPLRAAGSRVAISRTGRRPRAHRAARPHSRARRRPQHPWDHKQQARIKNAHPEPGGRI